MATVGGAASAEPQGSNVPKGGIIMYAPAYTAPPGWALCDGTNGTPNLRGQFIIGADSLVGGSYPLGSTGGAASKTSSDAGSHNHAGATAAGGAHSHSFSFSGTSGSTSLSTSQLASHAHKQYFRSACGDLDRFGADSSSNNTVGTFLLDPAGGTCPFGGSGYGSQPERYTGDGASHNHSISGSGTTDTASTHTHTIGTDGLHNHTINVLPPYYALTFIMKL